MLDLRGRRCLVVGGGKVAMRKIAGLLTAGARVIVVAPELDPALVAIAGAPVVLARRQFRSGDLNSVDLVITCTNDPAVNARVAAEATAQGIWVNSADDPANCTFTLPSVARQGDLTVAVSTNGKSPALSAWLRKRFEEQFDDSWSDLLEVLAAVRIEARQVWGTSEVAGWDAAFDSALVDLVRSGRRADAADVVRSHLGLVGAA